MDRPHHIFDNDSVGRPDLRKTSLAASPDTVPFTGLQFIKAVWNRSFSPSVSSKEAGVAVLSPVR